eukprot:10030339-Lingulodinium_polyedra.AAC.1
MVNLDCDNIVGNGFVESIVDSFGARAGCATNTDNVARRGHEVSTVRHVGYTAELFITLRGLR